MPLLKYTTVTAGSAEPGQWLFVLHGIYGAGRNWSSVIRDVINSRPDWGARLIDLREHGASRGFAPPHTMQAAADDLERLADDMGHPTAVIGHSFGGKVALLWGSRAPAQLRQIWMVDSAPGSGRRAGSAWEMLGALERLPGPFASRDVGVAALEEAGIAEGTARWMVTNLEPEGDRFRWRLDTDVMRALLEDFYRTDLWALVEAPPAGVEIHILRALGASTIPDAMAQRLRSIGEHARVELHEIEGGHWLNADNPNAVSALLAELLPTDG
ncbi:MAG: alpha/beta fold hydrolase [Longimicrobiales bacterium]